jgi:hypothetical protein
MQLSNQLDYIGLNAVNTFFLVVATTLVADIILSRQTSKIGFFAFDNTRDFWVHLLFRLIASQSSLLHRD